MIDSRVTRADEAASRHRITYHHSDEYEVTHYLSIDIPAERHDFRFERQRDAIAKWPSVYVGRMSNRMLFIVSAS
jgi:hypothetical protein